MLGRNCLEPSCIFFRVIRSSLRTLQGFVADRRLSFTIYLFIIKIMIANEMKLGTDIVFFCCCKALTKSNGSSILYRSLATGRPVFVFKSFTWEQTTDAPQTRFI